MNEEAKQTMNRQTYARRGQPAHIPCVIRCLARPERGGEPLAPAQAGKTVAPAGTERQTTAVLLLMAKTGLTKPACDTSERMSLLHSYTRTCR